jgi:hypothetical protein
MPHFSSVKQVTNVHACTQSPCRQKVPLGQSLPGATSFWQMQARQSGS